MADRREAQASGGADSFAAHFAIFGRVAELADAQDLGSCPERGRGSTPLSSMTFRGGRGEPCGAPPRWSIADGPWPDGGVACDVGSEHESAGVAQW